MQIYYLGPEGTFTHQAAMAFQETYALERAELISLPSVGRVIEAISNQSEDSTALGCIPIENSIQGSVTSSWDALRALCETEQGSRKTEDAVTLPMDFNQMLSACRLPITQNLLTANPLKLEDIKEVYSHPQALSQCKQWLHQNLPNASVYSVESTALAAEKIKQQQRSDTAAIASVAAASHYGLHVQGSNIQDSDNNMTRFGLFGKGSAFPERERQGHVDSGDGGSDCLILSLLLTGIHNCPGGLFQALGPFNESNLNLRRIESRPIGTDLGTYVFYLDIDWPKTASAEKWADLAASLRDTGICITNLGLYEEWDIRVES